MSYYSLEQALEVFQKNLPETLLPFDLPQLADLCRQGHIILLFPYNLHISKPCWYDEDDGRPMYAPGDTNKFSGHLTHDHLISLLDGYSDSLSLSDGAKIADDSDIRLYKHRQRDPDNTDPFTVTIKNIKIAASEVQAYIASNHFDDLTTPDKIRIAELESQVSDLEKQLQQQANTPADSVIHSNTDMQNVKQAAIKQFNISLATALIDLDYQRKLRKGDIVEFIIPYMEKLAFVLADASTQKSQALIVKYETIYENHLQGLGFKTGRQSKEEKEKKNIELLFKKQLPITE